MTLEEKAKQIARRMKLQGKYPWQARSEVKMSAVPEMYEEKLTRLVQEELKKRV